MALVTPLGFLPSPRPLKQALTPLCVCARSAGVRRSRLFPDLAVLPPSGSLPARLSPVDRAHAPDCRFAG